MGGLYVPRLKGTLGAVTAALPDQAGTMKRLHGTADRSSAPRNSGLRIRFARSGSFALLLAALSGCGLAEVERARMETGDAARQVSVLRSPQAGPRLSTVRLIERRPYVGLTRIEPDPRAGLPARFRSVDAVTLPLAGIGAAAVLAGRQRARPATSCWRTHRRARRCAFPATPNSSSCSNNLREPRRTDRAGQTERGGRRWLKKTISARR